MRPTPSLKKPMPAPFMAQGLADLLAEQGIDSLVVTGLTTSGCVRASAVDGLQHNFKVVIVEEATGDRDLAAHNANLYDLNAKYVDVLPLEETLQLL
jgi:nicotinamidase-related amidase